MFIQDEQLEDYGGRFSRSEALGYNFQPMGPVEIHVVGKDSWKEREVGKSEVEKFSSTLIPWDRSDSFLQIVQSFSFGSSTFGFQDRPLSQTVHF